MKRYSAHDMRRIAESYVRSVKSAMVGESFERPTFDEIRSAYDPEPYSAAATEKIVPSHYFAMMSYSLFNREFFGNRLPPYLKIEVKVEENETHYGCAGYRWERRGNGGRGSITPTHIILNSKWKMTFHEWLEVMLHECVHVYEYVMHPEPFLANRTRTGRSTYDAHGAWFLEHGAEFDSYGFHVRKYCQAVKGTFEINLDDGAMRKRYEKSKSAFLIARLVGIPDDKGGVTVKISRSFKPKFEFIVTDAKRRNEAWWSDIEKIEYYTTDNPMSIDWKKVSPRSSGSGFSYKHFDFAERRYGPFAKESEFVPREEKEGDNISEYLAAFGGNMRMKSLEKTFRSIVGRKFTVEWNTRDATKYITPQIRLPNGMMLDCRTAKYVNPYAPAISLNHGGTVIAVSEYFIRELSSKYPKIMDDYHIMDYYYDMTTGDGYGDKPNYTQSEAMNKAIDDIIMDIDDDESIMAMKKDILEEIDKYGKELQNASPKNESIIEEDIDDMPIEDRNIGASEEYARHMYDDVKGVENTKVNKDGSVDVEIW